MPSTEEELLLPYILLEQTLIQEYILEFAEFGTLASVPPAKEGVAKSHFKDEILAAFPWLQTVCQRSTFLFLLRASNFDLLAFISYYASALYRAGREAIVRQERGKALLWARHSRKETDGLCFNVKRKARRRPLDAASSSPDLQLDASKSTQAVEFIEAVKALLVCSAETRKEILAVAGKDKREGERWWWCGLRLSNTWSGVSETHRKTLYKACVVIATMLENMLKERKRYQRLVAMHRKIPQSFLISSLYVINPAPFISKIIPMYTWKPSAGTWSLCQRMAASLCGISKTQSQLDAVEKKLDENDQFQEKIKQLFSSNSELHSFEADAFYRELLVRELGIDEPSTKQVEYLKLQIRMKEKMDYVDHLGLPGASPFLKLCSELLPPLLNELAKVGTLHAIVSSFFDLLNKFWGSLEKYHDKIQYPNPPSSQAMVLELADHFHKFVENFYPILFKIALKSGTNDALPSLTILFDCLFGTLLGWNAESSSTTFHADLDQFLSNRLLEEERTMVLEYVRRCCELSEIGLDESEWPHNEVVALKLVPFVIEGKMTAETTSASAIAQPPFYIRQASEADSPLIVQLIRELAEYEKLLHACVTSETDLRASAFPTNGKSPLIYILIAHESSTNDVVGFALYFFNYSTFTGRPGLYLEDLFVREKYRANGLGTLFFERLKEIARQQNCSRMEWAVIDWNQSARNFYTKKMGADEKTEWIINRLDEDGLQPLSNSKL